MKELTFVYVATGEKYVREAAFSAASCRRHVRGCRILLVTPDDVVSDAFDRVVAFGHEIRDPFELKIAGIAKVDEERFVFLDTDTFILADVSEIDALLDRFDLAAAQAPVRLQSNLWPETVGFLKDAPVCFPEFNTGVIAFRRSDELRVTLERWLALHQSQARATPPPRTQDQASFRAAVFGSRLNLATLPPEYNCRFPYPTSVCGEVKILHGHAEPARLEQIGKLLNRTKMLRLITPDRYLSASVIMKSGNS
jgi:hypothetical protein